MSILIICVCLVSIRLPAQLNLLDFAEGIIEIEMRSQPFKEVSPNTYFYKEGNINDVIDFLSKKGILFTEQFGSSYIFENETEQIEASAMAITRWHNILVLYSD